MGIEQKTEKFYKKKWFAILMLLFFAPVGIILIWTNKHFEKKTNIILSIISIIWFVFILISGQPTEEERAEEKAREEQVEKEREDKEQKKKAEAEQKEAEKAAAKEEKEKEEIEKKKQEERAAKEKEKQKKEKEAKKKEGVEKKKQEDANRPINEKLEKDNDNVDKATLNDGLLTLEKDPGTVWSENSLFLTVYDLFEVMNEAFKDENVKEVEVQVLTSMVDSKGHEEEMPVIKYSYTKESFSELNYENFSNMAYGEQWRILTESDYYYIHPGIYNNLKDKYKDNLSIESFN